MPDGSIHPAEAAEMIREMNESGMYGRRAGRPLTQSDPLPPLPPGPPVEEPPLPQGILDEINEGRRASGWPEEPGGVAPQPAEPAPAPVVWATRAAPGPSGLSVPVILALKDGQLMTSAGDVTLTAAENKAFKELCAKILKRRIRETLAKIGP